MTLDGLPVSNAAPVYGLAGPDGRPLTAAEITALGDPAALTARAIANLDARGYTFETLAQTKGFLGLGKKPLAIAVRGPLAPERILSPAFLVAARAQLGNPHTIAVGLPDRQTIVLRNHDAPHFATAFTDFARAVVSAQYGKATEPLCNGTMLVRDGKVDTGWVNLAAPAASYPFATRAVRDWIAEREKPTLPADLEPVPELAPAATGVRLLGRHRAWHHLEVEIDAGTGAALGDAARSALVRMARAVPGTLVAPLTGVKVIAPSSANLVDLEWSLRHPRVGLYTRGKKNELVPYTGSSVRSVSDNLTLSLAELAARG